MRFQGERPSAVEPSLEELQELARHHDIPRLLVEIEDERARFRLREALYLSLIFHFILLGTVVTVPRITRTPVQVVEVPPSAVLQDREMTYLELPPALRQEKPPPDTKFMSDQDRIASSKAPQLDKKQLERVLDSAAGTPTVGNRGTGSSPAPPQPAPAPPALSQESQAQRAPAVTQSARLAQPSQAGRGGAEVPFRSTMSAGTAIQQAARASMGATGGDVPGGPLATAGNKALSEYEVLSNTMGVNFAPYLQRVLHDVRRNWYTLIPEVARAPLMKKGRVSVEFAIMKDGSVSGLTVAGPSGDVSLDRAAYGGITASTPFPPLPREFAGEHLALRFHFYYNPDRAELR